MAKIGKHAQAKKYKELREKQELANRMIKRARGYLKPDHKALKNLKAKKKQFYNTRGLKSPAQLSFKNLTRSDLKAYERLLDSIINDTYLNEEKYKKHKEKMRGIFAQSLNGTNAGEFDEFVESDIFEELVNMGLNPYIIREVYGEMYDAGYSVDDFMLMCSYFQRFVNDGNITLDSFFEFATEFEDYLQDFNTRVDNGEYNAGEFEEYFEEYYTGGELL